MTIIWSLDVSALDASGVQRGRSAYKRQNKSSLKVNSLKKKYNEISIIYECIELSSYMV